MNGVFAVFTIEEISDAEHGFIIDAEKDHGNYFTNVYGFINLLWEFITEPNPDAYILFLPFISQVRISMYLSLLSTIRRHDIQAMMMLRHALEASVLASYSLYNTNIDDFCETFDGLLSIRENIKSKAYSWIDTNFNEHSEKIRFFKGYINKDYAHANITHGFLNTDFSTDTTITMHLFDANNEDMEHYNIMIKQRLWLIGNIAFGVLDLFAKVVDEHPHFKLIEVLMLP